MLNEAIGHFRALLESAHSALEAVTVYPDRFECYLDTMFTTFKCSGGEIGGGLPLPAVDPTDNLDTGNPQAPVPGLQVVTPEIPPDAWRTYIGPETRPESEKRLKRLLVRYGVLGSARAEQLAVQVGAGTVNLFDASIRHLFRTPGDVLLVPETTYGFFLPHAYRSHGSVRMVPTGVDGKVNPATLGAIVDEVNTQLSGDSALLRRQHASSRDSANYDVGSASARPYTACSPDVAGFSSSEVGPTTRALLLIHPTISGALYHEDELRLIAEVLRRRSVCVIEDIAYLGLRTDPGDVVSIASYTDEVISLIGLSKSLAVSNLRVGFAVAPRFHARHIMRVVENSVGFVPGYAQLMVEELLRDPELVIQALMDNSTRRHDCYDAKLAVLCQCVQGPNGRGVSVSRRDAATRLILRRGPALVRELLVCEPLAAAAAIAGDRMNAGESEIATVVAGLLAEGGLGQWLAIVTPPRAGIFALCDATALLNGPIGRALGLSNAFDVFALFAHLFGVRTIPQEVMTTSQKCPPWLRLTFSPPVEVLLDALLRLFLGLTYLESGLQVQR